MGVSHKLTREELTEEITAAGLQVSAWYTDTAELFAVIIATLV